jgi:O-methyltransferase
MRNYQRVDPLDPLPMDCEWPSLRSFSGRVDIHTLAAFFVRENKLSGSYFEFGVASGRSAIAAIRANRRENPFTVSPFLLFDSFEGLPTLSGRDKGSKQFQAGDFAFDTEAVIKNLEQHKVYQEDKVHLIPGWFEDSLPAFPADKLGISRAAIVHIDVDLHSSCLTVLNFIEPFLQVGTVVLFDDWNAFCASRHKGERAATGQWLEENPQWELNDFAAYGWHGRAFIVDAGIASQQSKTAKPEAVLAGLES